MAFNNYAALIDGVVKIISRNSARSYVPGWIELTEKEAVLRIRSLRENIYIDTSLSLTADVDTLTLPDGITSILAFQINEVPILSPRSVGWDRLLERRAQAAPGVPRMPDSYHWSGAQTLELAPTPRSTESITLYYTGDLPVVSTAKYVSRMLVEAPQMLLYGAAKHFAIWSRNEKLEASYTRQFDTAVRAYGKFLARAAPHVQVNAYGTPGDRPQTTGGSL